MTAGMIVYMDETYLWTPEAPCPFTQEQLMTQDQMARPSTGAAPTPAQPGVASALDNLDYQRSELMTAVANLVDRIGPILAPEEPVDPSPTLGSKSYDSTVARAIEEHADGLKRLVEGIRSVTRRVDV